MKRICYTFLLLVTVLAVQAQMADPVHFTSALKDLGNGEGEIVFSATIDDGWHVYSTDLGQSGPIEATFTATRLEGVKLAGRLTPRGNIIRKHDPVFDMNLAFFEHAATFVQRVRFTKPHYTVEGYLEYGACNDEMCMPPTQVDFKQSGEARDMKSEAQGVESETQGTKQEDSMRADSSRTSASPVPGIAAPIPASLENDSSLWQPVTSELQAFEGRQPADNTSLWYIFMAGLLGGFLALLTPCVWPIIPMTVSFFLKRNKQRTKAIREALTYGASIIVIYVLLGLLVTLLYGPSALNALSTNAWFNIFFALLLIVFAASFFGAFELALPTSWSNKVDQKVDSTTGLLSIFLMAFTLVLVSFSCTGPIIGFLLVAVSTQHILGPTLGMLGFSIGLAIPFALFALFPSLLKQAPKSGGWMNTIKVVLGFVELAFALKFLSVADLAYGWCLLDREVFLALWIALFFCLSAYLFGWLRFPHDDTERRHTPVVQFFLGLLSLAFTVYMIPGLWGAPLKAISAFTPPMYTQDFNLQQSTVVEARFRDYDEGMAAARAEGKPVIIDFTGFGCVNCRKMEAAVWTDAEVAGLLTQDYVLISLYVDDKTPLAEPLTVTVGDRQRTLRTVGDKWSYLQATKFGANTQPFYVLLDADGRPLGPSRSYDEDVTAYADWLRAGLKTFQD